MLSALASRIRRYLSRPAREQDTGHGSWKEALQLFFHERAGEVSDVPSLEDLCYISGREPRLWTREELVDDLASSIVTLLRADERFKVVEVGCASGFLARAVAPRVGSYVGVDLAEGALEVARRLRLPNAEFLLSDGGALPFADGSFDAAFCYDVFTNFPAFSDGAAIISEMIRVVRPGGHALVGSIPDAATKEAYERRVHEVSAELDAKFGPPTHRQRPPVKAQRAKRVQPEILCYYFDVADFQEIGAQLRATAEIVGIHRLNPYFGHRFNVVYAKPAG